MPTRDRVDALISLVEQGKFVESLEQFYADSATMQENNDPPRVGLPALVDNERKVIAAFKGVRGKSAGPVMIEGDHVVINWIFEFTLPDGRAIKLDELTHQRWRGDKVIEERFYYDPKQMRP